MNLIYKNYHFLSNYLYMEGGIFKNLSKTTRALLFYLICIWIRLGLVYIVYKYSKYNIIIYLLMIISIIAIYLNYTKLNQKVWWNRKFHLIISFILLISTILILIFKINRNILSLILLIDIIYGISYSIIKKPFI